MAIGHVVSKHTLTWLSGMGHLGIPNKVASLHHACLVPGAWCLVPGSRWVIWVIWVICFCMTQMTQSIWREFLTCGDLWVIWVIYPCPENRWLVSVTILLQLQLFFDSIQNQLPK